MDSVHDLGGKIGFGAIETDADETPFHTDWEARMWGIAMAIAPLRSGSIDWWRHCRELIAAMDYLERPYFDSWMQTYAAFLINQGLLSVDELASMSAEFMPDGQFVPPGPEAAGAMVATVARFDEPTRTPPAFEVGEKVVCVLDAAPGHTRLPAYVRGRTGRVVAHHGAHVFPDRSACGDPVHKHLYTVEFASAALWPEAEGRADSVCLDLWQPYLTPAP